MALTAKQALFVKEYLVDFNATGAAIRAGYSEKTAKVIAHENLTKPYISEAIAEAQNKRSERVEWTADDILRDIQTIAKNGENDTVKLKALELGGRALALFTDKIKHSGDMGVKIINDIPKPK